MRSIPVVLVAAIAVVLAIFLASGQVFAHAGYASSTPSKGERMAAGPAQVEITFTQDIQKLGGTYGIEVVKDRGLDVTAGPAVVDDGDRTKLSVPLKPDLLPGRYVVNWKNASDEDGDPKEGAFSFYVGDYEPNTVDLANDAQLEQLGAEPEATPSTESTQPAEGETPTSTAPSGTGVATAPIPGTPGDTENTGGDGSGNPSLIVIVVGIAAVIAVAAGGFFVTRRGS